MSTIHGHVSEVTDKTAGDELEVAATINATTLVVGDVADFDEDGGHLAINGAVLEYATVDDDTDTITLVDPLPAAAGESDRVDVWDLDNDRAVVSYVALVAVDGMDQGDPLEVTVEHDLADKLRKSIRTNGGESVSVSRDGAALRISQVHGKTAQVDAVYSYVPALNAAKGSPTAIPTGPTSTTMWTTIPGWFVLKEDRITYDPATERFTVAVDGIYDIRVGVSFAGGGGGNRAVRMRYFDVFGADLGPSRMVKFPAEGRTTVETAQFKGLFAGQSVSFEAWQSSGADLEVEGSNVFTSQPVTDCNIRWSGPL